MWFLQFKDDIEDPEPLKPKKAKRKAVTTTKNGGNGKKSRATVSSFNQM